jgi:predicted nucleotidyltransferase
MTDEQANPLRHLNATEQDCVRRYVALLRERLGDNLVEVRLFGSAARGDMWSQRFPIYSDIDLLVLMQEPLSPEVREELVNATYPLYLECGRQSGPQWRTIEQWALPKDERAQAFKANVDAEGCTLYDRHHGAR